MTDTKRSWAIGQASFARAYLYFWAVRLWGDVPLNLNPIESVAQPEAYPIRAPKASVYAQIGTDIDRAVENAGSLGTDKYLATADAVKMCIRDRIYPDRFAGKERRVFLCGEAYADIAKNPKRSFVLSADDVDILVHGTSFRVSSYVNDSEVEVALLSGAIDMQTKNLQQNCKIQMTPGDMVKVDKRSGRVTSMRFPGGTFANGIDDGHLTFINSRLSDKMCIRDRYK